MIDFVVAFISAFWLGILTSASPCPLATNIAAISYVGRRLSSARLVLLGGVLYTLGRALTYMVLGALLVTSLLQAPVLSHLLQKYLNRAMGPLLVLIGMFLLGLLSLPVSTGGPLASRLQERLGRQGLLGAMALGMLFALSFCPVSAALFFGSLLPLAVAHNSGLLLPWAYGVGTGLPVLAIALMLGMGVSSLATTFKRLTALEKWARYVTGVIFVCVGVYLSLLYVFGVFS